MLNNKIEHVQFKTRLIAINYEDAQINSDIKKINLAALITTHILIFCGWFMMMLLIMQLRAL